ncbi:MAG: NHL repeat-containing protein [Acidobacteria bacterium]|nr:NHL repeat-containing protein [Acidobacteriota bacterium]
MPFRRIGLIGIVLATLVLVAVFARWGTRWTVPQALAATAGYTLRTSWTGADARGGPLQGPIGIAVAPSGDVYVTDAVLRVVQFSPDGRVRREWGHEGQGRGEFSNPVGIAVGPNGTVYVSDYEQDRIQTFSPTGEFLMEFGTSGSGPGQFRSPAGLAVDRDGSIYVADFYNHRVQKLTANGAFVQAIGRAGRLGLGALHYPTGVALTREREILVADAYNYQVQWFDASGDAIRQVGYHLFWLWPRPLSSTAGFAVPTDAGASPNGVIHVADSANHRVVMLSARGAYVADWRIPDANPDIYSPEHVAISPDGSTVYATDLAANRVLVLNVRMPDDGR